MQKLKKYTMYCYKWNDTYSFQGWHDEEGIDEKTVENQLQISVGIFIKEKNGWIMFSTHHNDHEGFEEYGIVTWVPKGCIISIERLYVKKQLINE